MQCLQSLISSIDLLDDVFDGGRPDEGSGVLVAGFDVGVDGGLELVDAGDGQALELALGEVGEEALHQVHPGGGVMARPVGRSSFAVIRETPPIHRQEGTMFQLCNPNLACRAWPFVLLVVGSMLAPGVADAQDAPARTGAVVEHRSLQPPGLARWTVEPAPRLVIGAAQGPPSSELFTAIAGVVQRSDGSIVIADAAADEVRVFTGEGEHLWSAGASGQGPGEFNTRIQLRGILPGDSVLVVEEGRASVFGPDGQPSRVIPLRPLGDDRLITRVVGVLGDGTLVATSQEPFEDPVGSVRPWLRVVTLDPSGSPALREIDRVQGAGQSRSQVQVAGPSGDIVTAWAIENIPLSPREQIAVGREHVAVGSQEAFEIRIHDAEGDLVTVLRADVPAVPTDLDRFVAEAPIPASASARRSQVDRSIIPGTLPRFGDLLFDSDDRLWVQEYMPPYASGGTEWWVFGTDGELVGRASLPDRFAPQVITTSHIIGVWHDALDVPYVQVLARAEEPG